MMTSYTCVLCVCVCTACGVQVGWSVGEGGRPGGGSAVLRGELTGSQAHSVLTPRHVCTKPEHYVQHLNLPLNYENSMI